MASNQTLMDTLSGESIVKYTREWGTKGVHTSLMQWAQFYLGR